MAPTATDLPSSSSAPSPPPPPPPPPHSLTDSDDVEDAGSASEPDGLHRRPSTRADLFRLLLDRLSESDMVVDDFLMVYQFYPVSPASIEALPIVCISDAHATSLPSCVVCNEDFALHSFALRLPCSHLYHSDCIVRWLSLSNSCPICRAQLPYQSSHGAIYGYDDGLSAALSGADDDTTVLTPALLQALSGADDATTVLTAALWQVRKERLRRIQHRLAFPVRSAALAMNAFLLQMGEVHDALVDSVESTALGGHGIAIGSGTDGNDTIILPEMRENFL